MVPAAPTTGDPDGSSHHASIAPDEVRLLLATAVHEFRSPLAAISGFAAFLRSQWDDLDEGDRLRYVESIERQAERLTGLTNDLLALSRLDSGVLYLEPTRVGMADVIGEVLESLAPTVEVVVECSGRAVVLADRRDVQEMLNNYIGNAIKYGEPPIHVSAGPVDDFVLVRVEDAGVGVPPEFVPRLFERFQRARTRSVRRHGGSGLGLAIVRSLAEAQGGRAWYEPGPDGATFCFTLPLADGRRLPRAVPA